MNQLIPVMNKLYDVFSTVNQEVVDLPQIAVVGSQSVGKSSVLENIVGRDFLPRGSDIVTRRPLVLQLINTSQNVLLGDDEKADPSDKSGARSEWGEFLHRKGERLYDFAEIRKEIETETDRVAPNKSISKEAISLKIYSPHVLNLTLVDLPGMTKVPVGNQPADIERRINKMVREFVSRPKCIVLAVSAATSDLATSDAMQMARQVDPKGVRTLGVVTKIDLMDQGTNALDVLTGKVIPLQLGYVGVVNRSQKAINEGKSIRDALKSEHFFFKNHTVYRSISNVCGTPYLAKKLNQILINHIKRSLPDLRQQINTHISDLQLELRTYGEPLAAKEQNKGALLLHLISRFSENFNAAIDGSGVMMLTRSQKSTPTSVAMGSSQPSNESVSTNPMGINHQMLNSTAARNLFGGARILYIFRTEFTHQLSKYKSFDGLSDDFILNSMRNASGIRSSLFIPEMCFENLVKIQIEKLRLPCITCVEMVYEELQRIAGQCQTPDITRFSKFRSALAECVTAMLKKHLEPCRVFVNELIDIELSYINTNHPDFISMDDVFTERVAATDPSAPQQRKPASGAQRPHHAYNANGSANINPNNPNAASNVDHHKERHNPNSGNPSHSNPHHSNVSQEKHKRSGKGGTGKGGGGFLSFFGSNAANDEQPSDNPKRSELTGNNPFHSESDTSQTYVNMAPEMHLPARRDTASQREQLELAVIKRFIRSYFDIVKTTLADIVPKSIMFMLVNRSKQRIQQDLALSLYREEQFEDLLSESPEIALKRKAAQDLLAILKKALDIINEVRDFKLVDF